MKIEKEGTHTYLKEDYVENIYFISMEYPLMKNNAIPSLLPMEFREQDGISMVYYEITGKESLEQIGQKKQFGYKDIRELLYGFLHLFHELDDYMLSLKQVHFDKECIFMDHKKNVYWIYGSKIHEEIQESIEAIFLWLLSLVDPEDTMALGLAHRVYSASKQGGITRDFVEQCLGEGKINLIESVQFQWTDDSEQLDTSNSAQILSNTDSFDQKEFKIEKKEAGKKRKHIVLFMVLKGILLLLDAAFLAYWIYFIHRYGMNQTVFVVVAVALFLLVCIMGSFLQEFLKKHEEKEEDVIVIDSPSSEELCGSNLTARSIFEELDEYWEKGQEIIVESEETYQRKPYLYNINTNKMEKISVFPFYIGNEEGLNQLSIAHKTVSRQHAVIMKKQDNQLYVEDLESKNGTWINGNRILPGTYVSIQNGDCISFGKENYQYCLE